jgi:hypothetical protein
VTRLTKQRNILFWSDFCTWEMLRDAFWPAVATAFSSLADRQFETSAQRLIHTLISSLKRQHSVYFTRWSAVRNVVTTFTSHTDRQFETSAHAPKQSHRITNAAVNASKWISDIKQQSVASHRHSDVQQTEEVWQIFDSTALKQARFWRKYDNLNFLWTLHFDGRRVCNPAA